jgi:GNAT superfamily N-acetyltransferase
MASSEVRIDHLAAHPQLIEQVGLLRWREWAYGEKDPTRFVDVSRDEAGDGVRLPMTLVAIDSAGNALGVVGLGSIDDEVSDVERGGRTPWTLGMVVAKEARMLGVGRLLLLAVQEAAAGLGHPQTWVATGEEAVRFYQRCGWEPIEHLRLQSTSLATTILAIATRAERHPARPPQAVGPTGQEVVPKATVLRERSQRSSAKDRWIVSAASLADMRAVSMT